MQEENGFPSILKQTACKVIKEKSEGTEEWRLI